MKKKHYNNLTWFIILTWVIKNLHQYSNRYKVRAANNIDQRKTGKFSKFSLFIDKQKNIKYENYSENSLQDIASDDSVQDVESGLASIQILYFPENNNNHLFNWYNPPIIKDSVIDST